MKSLIQRVRGDLRTPTSQTGSPNSYPRIARRLAKKVVRRGRRWTSGILPPPGRLPHDWRTQRAPRTGTDPLRSHFLDYTSGHWLFAPRDVPDIARRAAGTAPATVSETIAAANNILSGSVTIFGRTFTDLGDPPAWDIDPRGGRRWPDVPSPKVPIVYPSDRSDIKFPWELARFHDTVTLGLAYAYTRDARYALVAKRWIADFITTNRYGYGLHWVNPMEAAIRAVNWITTWQLVANDESWDERFASELTASLVQHGRFIAANLESASRGCNTNHYTADLLGLYAIGTFLPEWPEADHWRALAREELLAEANAQIAADGFHYENSFGYHRLTAEMLFLAWRLGVRSGDERIAPLAAVLRQMVAPIALTIDRDGMLPHFGDCDDGWILRFDARPPTDARPTLDVLTRALGNLEATSHARGMLQPTAAAIWLLDEDRATVARPESLADSDHPSRLLRESGFAIMHSPGMRCLAFANPVGTGGIGGHKHNDILSLTLDVDGVPFIVDSGTGAYTEDPVRRNRMRASASHAVVMVDGAEQNRLIGDQLFFLWNDAHPTIEEFTDDEALTTFIASHDGYRRLPGRISCRRGITLDKAADALTVTDTVTGDGTHDIAVVWPLGDIDVDFTGGDTFRLTGRSGRTAVTMRFAGAGDWRPLIRHDLRSMRYAQWQSGRTLVCSTRAALPVTVTTSWQAIPGRGHVTAEAVAGRVSTGRPRVPHEAPEVIGA